MSKKVDDDDDDDECDDGAGDIWLWWIDAGGKNVEEGPVKYFSSILLIKVNTLVFTACWSSGENFFTVVAISEKNWSIEFTGRSDSLFSKIYFIRVDDAFSGFIFRFIFFFWVPDGLLADVLPDWSTGWPESLTDSASSWSLFRLNEVARYYSTLVKM